MILPRLARRLLNRTFRSSPGSIRRYTNRVLQLTFDVAPTLPTVAAEVQPWKVEKPLLSAIVPCHNCGQYIRDAMKSIQSQTFQDFEAIVVDDASTDRGTLQVVNELKQEGVNVLRLEDLGPAESRNRGIVVAKGKYICCVDADDTLEPTYFEKCLCLLESNPGVAYAYSHLRTFGDEHEVGLAEPYNLRLLMDYNQPIAAAVFRRDAWEAVGGYDSSMWGYEDWEFWIRLGASGFRGKLIPEALFNYRKHGSTLQSRAQKTHRVLMERIRANNADLYSNPKRAERIAERYVDYKLSNPLRNMSSPKQYIHFGEGTTAIIVTETLEPRNSDEANLYRTLRGLNDLNLILVTTNPQKPLRNDPALELPSYVYNLPRFLDSYCWLHFVLNLIRTRSVEFVIALNSKLGCEWSREIKGRTSTRILSIVTRLRNDYGTLVKKFDQYVDHYISLSAGVTDSLVYSLGIPQWKVYQYAATPPSRDSVAGIFGLLEKLRAQPRRFTECE